MTATRFPVEIGHILMFARAIGDQNPAYLAAPEKPDSPVFAPPTFVMAAAHVDPDYPLRPSPSVPWHGSGREPGVAREGGGGLHAEQHFEYHRPVRAGDILTPRPGPERTWEKNGRTGRLAFVERVTEFCDEAGEPVVTARSVSVVPEAPVTRGAQR